MELNEGYTDSGRHIDAEQYIDAEQLKEENEKMIEDIRTWNAYIAEYKNKIDENRRKIEAACEHDFARDLDIGLYDKTSYVCTKCNMNK